MLIENKPFLKLSGKPIIRLLEGRYTNQWDHTTTSIGKKPVIARVGPHFQRANYRGSIWLTGATFEDSSNAHKELQVGSSAAQSMKGNTRRTEKQEDMPRNNLGKIAQSTKTLLIDDDDSELHPATCADDEGEWITELSETRFIDDDISDWSEVGIDWETCDYVETIERHMHRRWILPNNWREKRFIRT